MLPLVPVGTLVTVAATTLRRPNPGVGSRCFLPCCPYRHVINGGGPVGDKPETKMPCLLLLPGIPFQGKNGSSSMRQGTKQSGYHRHNHVIPPIVVSSIGSFIARLNWCLLSAGSISATITLILIGASNSFCQARLIIST